MKGRYAWLEQTLGSDLVERVLKSKVLVVGAGGIGCELLKDLVLSGFLDIVIVDLDTIDLSNLNRQFLFQKQHISKSKAHVARESALRFNPEAKIHSHHGNIMTPEFNQEYFKQFNVVLNALDNLAARRHVNRLCLAAGVPLVESGTEGYLGQVTVIKKDETECFECQPKPAPKTFPICTIRSTPSSPIHCVVWAKNYLFNQLFGKAEEEESAEVDPNAENADELKALRKEAEALKELRRASAEDTFGALVFEKVFERDIQRLLGMAEMWKNRKPPTPIRLAEVTNLVAEAPKDQQKPGLRDQQLWSLAENVSVFLRATNALGKRAATEELSFDKDDGEMLDFVTATTNLRAHIFAIEQKTRFKVKEMAGNIIPAIATTNAIIAGLIVLQAFHLLAGNIKECSTTYLVHGGRRPKLLMKEPLAKPNRNCYVCQNKNVALKVNTKTLTLRTLVEAVFTKSLAMTEISISDVTNAGARLLYDAEFDDNLDRSLGDLGIGSNSLLNVDDEAQDFKLVVSIVHSEEFEADSDKIFEILGSKPNLEAKKAEEPEPSTGSGQAGSTSHGKRKLEDIDDDLIIVDPADDKGKKKQKLD